mmetsp:Transcript_10920/g.26247  ORF Transcript_10920/g.26247 Transcript_10920/m.26247 type:complete len:201 (-) Transcript_10920:304-906(-)
MISTSPSDVALSDFFFFFFFSCFTISAPVSSDCFFTLALLFFFGMRLLSISISSAIESSRECPDSAANGLGNLKSDLFVDSIRILCGFLMVLFDFDFFLSVLKRAGTLLCFSNFPFFELFFFDFPSAASDFKALSDTFKDLFDVFEESFLFFSELFLLSLTTKKSLSWSSESSALKVESLLPLLFVFFFFDDFFFFSLPS